MAEQTKKPIPEKTPAKGAAPEKGDPLKAKPTGEKPAAAKPTPKPESKAPAPAEKKEAKPEAKKAAPAEKKGAEKKADEKVTIVEEVTKRAEKREHKARAKAELSPELRKALQVRREIDGRRPTFKHQQWYEYKRLEDLGWRRPNGVDSAMRRHFGYEQSVVRVGFRGPVAARGLHPSGFQEVAVARVEDLAGIDPKRQAARVSRTVGTRKLRLIYAEAEKKGIRVLNRRQLE